MTFVNLMILTNQMVEETIIMDQVDNLKYDRDNDINYAEHSCATAILPSATLAF